MPSTFQQRQQAEIEQFTVFTTEMILIYCTWSRSATLVKKFNVWSRAGCPEPSTSSYISFLVHAVKYRFWWGFGGFCRLRELIGITIIEYLRETEYIAVWVVLNISLTRNWSCQYETQSSDSSNRTTSGLMKGRILPEWQFFGLGIWYFFPFEGHWDQNLGHDYFASLNMPLLVSVPTSVSRTLVQKQATIYVLNSGSLFTNKPGNGFSMFCCDVDMWCSNVEQMGRIFECSQPSRDANFHKWKRTDRHLSPEWRRCPSP